MHRYFFRELVCTLAANTVFRHDLDHHADLAAGVDVDTDRCVRRSVVTREATNGDVLLDRADPLRNFLTDGETFGIARPLLVEQRVDVVRVALRDHARDFERERLKVFVAADEVGLAIHFDEHTAIAFNVRDDSALCGHASRFLSRGGESFLAKDLRRLFHVTVRFSEGVLHVHHAGAGALAQILDHCARNLTHGVTSLRLK